MDRIVVGTVGTIYVGFEVDEVDTDSGATVTVAGVGLDGTTLFSANAADAAGTGNYSYLVEAADTTQPDQVKVTWTGTFSAVAQTVRTDLAIVGDNYFTIGQLRSWEPSVASATSYPLASLREARSWAETRAEQIMGRSFVRSARKFTFTGDGKSAWHIPVVDARSVRAVTVDGVAQTLTNYTLENATHYPLLSGSWPSGETCTVIVEHGAQWVPADVSRAVATLAAYRATLSNSGVASRSVSWQADAGIVMRFDQPAPGKVGLPEVDAVLSAYAVPGFA